MCQTAKVENQIVEMHFLFIPEGPTVLMSFFSVSTLLFSVSILLFLPDDHL